MPYTFYQLKKLLDREDGELYKHLLENPGVIEEVLSSVKNDASISGAVFLMKLMPTKEQNKTYSSM